MHTFLRMFPSITPQNLKLLFVNIQRNELNMVMVSFIFSPLSKILFREQHSYTSGHLKLSM